MALALSEQDGQWKVLPHHLPSGNKFEPPQAPSQNGVLSFFKSKSPAFKLIADGDAALERKNFSSARQLYEVAHEHVMSFLPDDGSLDDKRRRLGIAMCCCCTMRVVY